MIQRNGLRLSRGQSLLIACPSRYIQSGLSESNFYSKPMQRGELMRSTAIARVLQTKGSTNLQEGDLVRCAPGWTEFAVLPAKSLRRME
jgi:NADPH-dependent curcumin reductase CurA